MIRILQIMDNINIQSGVSSIVMNLYRNIDRNKVQFDFLVSVPSKLSYEKEILELGGKIFYTGNPLSIGGLYKACQYNKNFFEKHAAEYIAVHLQSPTIAEMTIRYAKEYGVKHIIIHSHSTMFSNNPVKKIINKVLIARLKEYATDYWYCSTEAANFLYGKGYADTHNGQWIRNAINPIANTFDNEKRNKIRQQLGVENYKVACHVSNFSPIKNLEFLVNVIKSVVRRDKTWRFVFVGEGPCKKTLQRRLEEEALTPFCIFTGFTNDVNLYLNGADVFLLPSIKEGLPVVAIEAQATGLPCLISDTVTREADIGGITYLSLNDAVWIHALTNLMILNNHVRFQLSKKFEKSGFNIQNESQRVQHLYLEMNA